MQLKNLLFVVVVPVIFAGCGSGSDSSANPHGATVVAASQSCVDASCHGSTPSPGTGELIAQEWQASAHATSNAAGCADCHEPGPAHPSLCAKCHGGGSYAATRNPDSAGNCNKCHGPSFPSDILMALAPQHYGYSSATALPTKVRASYVGSQYDGRCRACHNPHTATVTPQHREWVKSLHGDPKGAAWTHYDMKQDNFALCSRCHTSTGFKAFVTSNFTVPTKGFSTSDPRRELIACDACHASYDFGNNIRQLPAFTAAPYKGHDGVNKAAFPDVGESNLCIPCHTGLTGGQAISSLPDNKVTNGPFVNSHYLAAAGLMYMQNGFTGFAPATTPIGNSTYGASLAPDSQSTPGGLTTGTLSIHRMFGTPLITQYRNYFTAFVPGVADQNGPCVTCHMNASGLPVRPGNGHSMKIDANAFTQLCSKCHKTEGTHTSVIQLSADNFRSAFLEPQAEAYHDALKLIQTMLEQKYSILYLPGSYPYFFDPTLPPPTPNPYGYPYAPVTDWTRGGTVDGRKLMGACFNLNLLTRDPGGFAHARTYSRRLVYDSIDFLDDETINLTVGATALASGLKHADNSLVFTKGTKAYNVNASGPTTIYDGTSDAMLYLIGWNRYTGEWSTPERP